jgi:hypothetical protein
MVDVHDRLVPALMADDLKPFCRMLARSMGSIGSRELGRAIGVRLQGHIVPGGKQGNIAGRKGVPRAH